MDTEHWAFWHGEEMKLRLERSSLGKEEIHYDYIFLKVRVPLYSF